MKIALYSKKSAIGFIVKILIAFGIIFWLFTSHYHAFINAISNIDYSWIILALVIYIMAQIAAAFRWYLLLQAQNLEIAFFDSLSLAFQGLFFSLVIPGGALGGDIVRIGLVVSKTRRGAKLVATSTVFADRFLGMFAQFSVAIFIGLLFFPEVLKMNNAIRIIIILVLIASCSGITVGILILAHRKLERFKIYKAGKQFGDLLTKGYISKATDVIDIYNRAKTTIVAGILISFAGFFSTLLVFYSIARSLHESYFAIKPLVLSIGFGNIVGLLPITPLGLGTRDVFIKTVLSNGGFLQGVSVAIPLLFSSVIIVTSLFGGLFFVFHSRHQIEYRIIKETEN